jgi:hypothetical protein
MPAPTAPTTYRSYVPLESYQDALQAIQRAETETAKIQEQRYREVGTPAEIGARQRGRDVKEQAAYLASIPSGDKYLEQVTGVTDPNQIVRGATQQALTEAQAQYADALKKVGEKPEPRKTTSASWAERTV